ncbi:MAG: hypothetical protein K5877_05910 [Lachnospiraceae bacterium]|nr:hypothetical protein [Lachnospiraceae bacterium]
MTTSEIHDYAYDLFRHSPAILYEFLDLPVEVELPEELGNTANDYYNEDITEWLSDTYGYCVETFTYVKGDLLRKLKRCMAVRSSLFSSF